MINRKDATKHQVSMRNKFIIFFSAFFLLLMINGSAVYVSLIERITLDNAGEELIKIVELERLKLEASVNSEIAIVLKMADSPLIKRYFSDPKNQDLEKMAFEELAAYRRAFTANSVFWVNNIDKIFYSGNYHSYKVDPENPDNYWYNKTLYKTDVYNFNINYNPDLNVTNLWINAPVFDSNNKPIGIVGTGINLSDFINTIYLNYSGAASMYFFNSDMEITGANDIKLVAEKICVDNELGQNSAEILAGMSNLEAGEIKFIKTKNEKGVAVVGTIPVLDWYVTAYQHISTKDAVKNGMTIFFIVMIIIMMVVVIAIFNVLESRHAKGRAEAAREAVISSIEYASRIQTNLLPCESAFGKAFSDYSIIWKPRDIVGGDIYWIKNFEKGTVLCVCDCTGHGTPGALLSMLVVSVFEAVITENNCRDTAQIIWELEKRLTTALNSKSFNEENRGLNIKDGCDLAVMFIAKDGSVTSSSSHTHIFICDGKNVTQIRGQRIFVGEGNLKSKDEIKTVNTSANRDSKFYIASDGLFDQPGGAAAGESGVPFGYTLFKQLILENHNKNQTVISDKIWTVFEEHRGETPRVDDFELITFKPRFDFYQPVESGNSGV